MPEQSKSRINWRDWSKDAFDEARRDDKLILLCITASWCHWCHVMDRTTYSDPIVIRLVNDRFIPIRVDGDKRPDVQDRYLLGGWPTTAVLSPEGYIINGSTYLPPDALITMLCETNMTYYEHKHAPGLHIKRDEEAWYNDTTTEKPSKLPLDATSLSKISSTLKREFDPWHGGFGTEPKFPYPDAVKFAFLQYQRENDAEMLQIATKTLDGMLGIYDKVWGGFYRYSNDGQWTQPHYEKVLYLQASLLENYLDGYQITRNECYARIALGTKQYVDRWLCDREKGGFYASQDADVGADNPNGQLIPGEEYYSKNEDERLKIGVPSVDKTIFTDWNGMMISAYFRLDETIGSTDARDFALKTLDRLLNENLTNKGMCHYVDGEPCVPGLLSDQVYFAQALLDGYRVSGKKGYLDSAKGLVCYMLQYLLDQKSSGFYFKPPSHDDFGELARTYKPLNENAAASKLLIQLYLATNENAYWELARQTLEAIAHPQVAEGVRGATFGLALDMYLRHLELSTLAENRVVPRS